VDHFVQYHNVDERGPLDTNEHPVFVTTAKRWPSLVGQRVWLISGEGTPKSYALCGSFVVKEVTTPVPGSKDCRVYGGHERWLARPIPIDSEQDWFRSLRMRAGNFGLGLHPIVEPSIAALLQLSSEHRDRA
jgi:hypothetical protein